jgi:amino acid transporter/nucleotide-binding universal stress UspA family protein
VSEQEHNASGAPVSGAPVSGGPVSGGPVSAAHAIEVQTELSRDLGLTSALAIGVGTMIAAGIFTLSGLAVRNVGSAAVVAFLAAAAVALLTALTYCEFAATYPETGEGYLYARNTFPPLLAYAVGWCLVLGYTSSCAFYIASLSTYFQEFVWHTPFQQASGLIALVALTLLNMKGTKESGGFQIVVTAAKVLLLIWFVSGGLSSVNSEALLARFETDVVKIGATSAMVFITFFGFSAIAASAGEVKNPVRTIPRAIFLSMGLVTLLYTAVVVVVVAAGLTEYTEAAMGRAAQKFLGPVGAMVIVGGALFSMVSASNASIMAGSRVVMAMSRFGHLPANVGKVHPTRRTPVQALWLVGAGITVFAVALPLEDLAHFADTVLLVALTLVNAALIANRRKFPKLHRPFRAPLVPVLPALGMIANLYLLKQIAHHTVPFGMALSALAAGVGAYVFWSRGREPVERPALAPAAPPSILAITQHEGSDYRVLVPIANPDNAEYLVDLASAIAKPRNGELLVMRVVLVPDQTAPTFDMPEDVERERAILERAEHRAAANGIRAVPVVRVAHRVDDAILQASREHDCALIVLGWKGYTTTAGRILGETTDRIVRHTHSNVLLVRRVGRELPKRRLLPTAGGPHAQQAERYAAALAGQSGGELTVCRVVPEAATEQQRGEAERMLAGIAERIEPMFDADVGTLVAVDDSVSGGIIAASRDFDAVVLGAAQESRSQQILFGTIPDRVAKRVDRTVLMVKRGEGAAATAGATGPTAAHSEDAA